MRRVSILIAVPVVLLVIAGAAWVFLQQSGRPWRTGEQTLPGLGADVTVRFDARGVPHVRAESDADLFRALGFLHANDRLTQMELGRRAAAGRLAELVGETAFEFDVYFRTMRFPETSDALWQAASPRSKEILEAYSAGVNAYINARSDLPPGLRILGADLEPWRPQDSLAFSLLMARDLSFWNARPEEERFVWLRAFGADKVRDLLDDPELHVPAEILNMAEDAGPLGAVAQLETPDLFDDGALRGSNNWAVAGSRTASGRAMVANDPHLPLFLPSVWYQVQLRSPGYEASGMSLPGTPGVVLGRGPHVAWAFTNVMLDDHDVFFERLDDTGTRYLRGEEWLDLEQETITLKARGGATRNLVLRRTDRGPLFDADEALGLPARSLSWAAHEPGDPIAALLGVAGSKTPEELIEATRPYVAPAQNLVAAFETGELVYTMLGKTPDRLLGNGRIASPGWDLAYGWSGLREHELHPRRVDPEEGLIVTANHDILAENDAAPFTAEFFGPSRADRIREALLEGTPWDLNGFGELQMDKLSLHAGWIIEQLEQDGPFTGDAGLALEALLKWNRQIEVKGESALWILVDKELLERIWGDDERAAGITKTIGHRKLLLRLLRGEMAHNWFDDVTTDAVETRSDIVEAALAAAWATGSERWGSDVDRWDYGALHPLPLNHRLDAVPVYGRWSRRGPYPVPGSATTVLAFGAFWEGDVQRIRYGPSMRFITDWSDPERSWAVLPGGQSGHPADPHYDDQIAPYFEGQLFEAPWSEAAIEAATQSTLTLTP